MGQEKAGEGWDFEGGVKNMNNDSNKRMSEEREKEEKALITFLKRTKEGEYAKIDERQLAYPRVKEQRAVL